MKANHVMTVEPKHTEITMSSMMGAREDGTEMDDMDDKKGEEENEDRKRKRMTCEVKESRKQRKEMRAEGNTIGDGKEKKRAEDDATRTTSRGELAVAVWEDRMCKKVDAYRWERKDDDEYTMRRARKT